MTRGLLDTSTVIALAQGAQPLLPDEAAISTITLCGLHHGVLVADKKRRPGRLATLVMAERRFNPLPVDERVAPYYGRIISASRRAGSRRLKMGDALIAATAIAHHLTLYTLDSDFNGIEGLELAKG